MKTERGFMRSFLAAFAFLLAVLSGCSPVRVTEPKNLFWPMPPEKPRIHYIQSIYSEDSIGHEYSIKELLFGKAYMDTMNRPYGVSARAGRVYVTDIMNMRVMIYDLNLKKYVPFAEDVPVRVPSVAIAKEDGTVFVADAAGSKIALYDASGTYRTSFLLADMKPVALAHNEHLGLLYVLDRIGHKVVVLDESGARRFEFGGRGREDGKFNIAIGIAVDRNGKVYVLDTGNFRVQIFDAQGKFLSKFGSVGDRPGFFSNPKGIAVDSEGHIYVTDAAFSNFQIFDPEGKILLVVGKTGSGPGQLYLPAGIFIDEQDRIYVADQLNRRISVFQFLKSD